MESLIFNSERSVLCQAEGKQQRLSCCFCQWAFPHSPCQQRWCFLSFAIEDPLLPIFTQCDGGVVFSVECLFCQTSATFPAKGFEGDGDLEAPPAPCAPSPLLALLVEGQHADNPRPFPSDSTRYDAAGSALSLQLPSSLSRRHLGCLAALLCSAAPDPTLKLLTPTPRKHPAAFPLPAL